jgi:hypothetical protein
MRRVAVIAMIALATTGCIGSGNAESSHGHSQPPSIGPFPKTDVTITYPDCPPGGKCLVAQASRRLKCSPTGGDYDNPAAACRALRDIVTKQRQRESQPGPLIVCRCVMSTDSPKAVGSYGGKRRTIRLDACSLCNLSGIHADLAVLLPGGRGSKAPTSGRSGHSRIAVVTAPARHADERGRPT